MCVHACHMPVGLSEARSTREQVIGSHLIWVPETKLQFSARAGAPNG